MAEAAYEHWREQVSSAVQSQMGREGLLGEPGVSLWGRVDITGY